ncbi:tRNA pseudouridine(55) synthase TruB [Thermodesulfobacteriota bacterium]
MSSSVELNDNRKEQFGVVFLDKPVGPTSFDMVRAVRRATGVKKVGHAGTLDPLASGLLIICIGRPATKMISRLMAGEKEYEATLQLGIETDTQDSEGKIVAQRPVGMIAQEDVERCLAGFVGRQLQTPPAYSALKHKGKSLYYYARKGIAVVKEPRPIEIHLLETVAFSEDKLTFRVVCGKGTYVRTLAADIGKALGPGACLVALRRTRSGPFSVSDALPGEMLQDRDQGRELLRTHILKVDVVLDTVKEAEK